ncbi:MAG: hypothetical protein ACR2O4_06340, partial [Hyphomicrobiaceae bacterium]
MAAMDLAIQKDSMRKLLYKRRAAAAKQHDESVSANLANVVVRLLNGKTDGHVISAFLPIRTEINTRPLIEALNGSGATTVLPTVLD